MTQSKLAALGRRCARHPWRTVGIWIVAVLTAAVLIATLLGSALTTTGASTNEPESLQAQRLVEKQLRGPARVTELVILRSEGRTVDDPAFKQHAEEIAAGIRGLGGGVVENVLTYTQVPDPGMISKDRHAALIPVTLTGTLDEASVNVDRVIERVDAANGREGYQVLIAGTASTGEDYTKIAEHDAMTGETVGIAVALLILVLVFGALVAASVPVILAAVSVIAALGLTALVGQAWNLTFTVTNIITMMGLAVGIDYSLFIVSRFREEREKGRSVQDAIARAQATAGRAVLFSGMTVIVALSGLFVMPSTVFRSLAAGAVMVVGVAIVAGLTLLPAILALLGDRVNGLQPRRLVARLVPQTFRARFSRRSATPDPAEGSDSSRTRSFWERLAHGVMARPVISLIVAIVPMLIAASFYFDLNPGTASVTSLPDSARTKAAFQMLEKEFSFGLSSPVEVVVEGSATDPAVARAIKQLQSRVAADPSFAGPGMVQPSKTGDISLLSLSLSADPNAEVSEEAVRRLRSEHIPAAFAGVPALTFVGGQTASNVDFFGDVSTYTPWVFAFVLGLSFLLLTAVFRSLVVPVKAIAMNLLSVGCAYGLLVLVFQHGVGAGLLGFQQTPRIEAWLPIFLFAILFGLSMDYHVLLLSRIRERYDETGDNTEAVAFGLTTTARLITGAAVIMVAVFGGFAAGDLVMFQQMGFGLAVAVLVDATIVRSVLVPAAMKLLGAWNWWLPRPLAWIPDLRVEPAPERQPVLVRERAR